LQSDFAAAGMLDVIGRERLYPSIRAGADAFVDAQATTQSTNAAGRASGASPPPRARTSQL